MHWQRPRKKLSEILSSSSSYIGETINVSGWLTTIRKQSKNSFAFGTLNDGSCQNNLQLIFSSEYTNKEELENFLQNSTTGVSIQASGKVVESPAKGQDIELQVSSCKVLGTVDAKTYPMSKKRHGLEHLRKFEHLRPRTNVIRAVAKVRNQCAKSTHDFFQNLGFQYIHTPLLTANDCEGAGETFTVTSQYPKTEKPTSIYKRKEFFGKPVNLTVSGQLHGESYACALGEIYTFGPTFRAENSNTSRHLAEFWMIEPEVCFINLDDLMNLAESYLKHCITSVLQNCKSELEFLNGKFLDPTLISKLNHIMEKPFKRISYTQAIEELQKADKEFEEKPEWGIDLPSEHERYLAEEKYKCPVIVYNYPEKIKSFYMKKNTDGKTVQAMDVLVPQIGEIIGGSMREDNYQTLKEKMEEKEISGLDWYLDLRKYGSVPHGGFGLGFERLVQLCSGMTNIRDVIPYPRYPKHCNC